MHGVKMEPGDHVMLMLGSADTDTGEFGDQADEADFAREHNRHLAFGGGAHRCLGSHLARAELRVALEALHRRMPDYRIPDGAELKYSPGIREIEHLPLDFTPGASGRMRVVLDSAACTGHGRCYTLAPRGVPGRRRWSLPADRERRSAQSRSRARRGVVWRTALSWRYGWRSRSNLMELREAVIVDAVRTPIGKRNGALAGWHPTDLLALDAERAARSHRRRSRAGRRRDRRQRHPGR